METSEKQRIYLDILSLVLPTARNVQTWSAVRRIRTNLYPELELVHGLPPLIDNPEFSVHDVHWINTQGKNFIDHYRVNPNRFHSIEIAMKIGRLVALVPAELRTELALSQPPRDQM